MPFSVISGYAPSRRPSFPETPEINFRAPVIPDKVSGKYRRAAYRQRLERRGYLARYVFGRIGLCLTRNWYCPTRIVSEIDYFRKQRMLGLPAFRKLRKFVFKKVGNADIIAPARLLSIGKDLIVGYFTDMQKHPLISVKEAAELLRLDERSVRERLINGQLKGEKKQIGLRDKWFVYSGSIDAALAKQQGSWDGESQSFVPERPIEVSQSIEPDIPVVDGAGKNLNSDWLAQQREAIKELAEELVKPLTEELQRKNKDLQDATFRLGYVEGKLKEQAEQIKLLPDYEARAKESERMKEEAASAKLKVEELKKELLQREEEKRKAIELKELEAEALRKQMSAIEEEKALAAAKAQEEIDLLKHQKEEEGRLVQEQLKALSETVLELKKPWWKKWFSGPTETP